jgi:hypothetical protein
MIRKNCCACPRTKKRLACFRRLMARSSADLASRKVQVLREINQRNLGYFEQEVEKLDAWADDLKLGLEQEIKGIDFEIKEVRRHSGDLAHPRRKAVPPKAPAGARNQAQQAAARTVLTRQDASRSCSGTT